MKKITATLLALAMVLALTAVIPLTAQAADQTVTIAQTDTTAQIESKIQTAIDAAGAGEKVTVTGSRTGVNAIVKLTIPENKKVVWKAIYTGSSRIILELFGAGIFEVAEGADIQGTDDWIINCNASGAKDLKVLVSGGSVSGSATAIGGNKSDIIVTGGTLSSTGKNGCAIRTDVQGAGTFAGCAGNVTIDGGEILATGSNGTAINTTYGNIIINKGTITTTGESGQSVYTGNGNVEVNGGTITAVNRAVNISGVYNGNFTIYGGIIKTTGIGSETVWVNSGILAVYGGEITAEGNNSKVLGARNQVIVCGGTVNAAGADSYAIYLPAGVGAYLEGTCTGQFSTDPRYMLVEVDKKEIPKSRNGTNRGITIKTGTGTAVWDCSGVKPQIVMNPQMVGTYKIEWGEYYTPTYKILLPHDDYGIWGLTPGGANSTVGFVKSKIEKANSVELFKGADKLTDDKPVVTGTRVVIDGDEYFIIIYGDIDGDGAISASDLLALKKHLLNIKKLEDPYLKAAKCSRGVGVVGAADLLALKKDLLKITPIKQD